MIERLRSLVAALRARPRLLALAVLFALATAGSAGLYGYRTYDYVQHDNDFCISCHLMEVPFEEFARSAHRGLGCKACHQPTIVERSAMGLTQVVDRPLEIEIHADVPNERCAGCHVEGDPETWESIRNSAGHLTHLQSDSLDLSGLMCVECHSSSVHQFTPTDQTCGQSGCHDETKVQLGRMGDFTIHCTACHGFLRPVEGAELEQDEGSLAAEAGRSMLRPGEYTCLSCHAMRVLVELPDEDPHEADCAACHNPHEQTLPEQAVENCASADCHGDSDELSGYHQGLEPGAFEACMDCHGAHDFHLDGTDCRSCHEEELRDGPPPASKSPRRLGSVDTVPESLRSASRRLANLGAGMYVHVGAQVAANADTTFYHSQHVDAQCVECHDTQREHGAPTVTSQADCRSCHHREPVVGLCQDCHQTSEFAVEPYQRVHEMAFDVVEPMDRTLPFLHSDHESEDCEACHTEGLALSSTGTSCSKCHEEHHEPEVACRSCHEEAPDEAHPVEVHVGCSGAGCHEESAFDMVPRVDEFCLTCHQDLVEHKPESEQTCEECHTLPDPVARSN